MAETRNNGTNCHEGNQKAMQIGRNKSPIQTQLIDSRHVRDPTHLVLLLNDEYGNGNYEVEMRHNCFTIRAPGRLQWSHVSARCR
ncbi:hypothetical protein F4805DRAFT_432794 [Annulohypoxylon moriforme]|nr:hypothetical protein F4805DRAFT_432794 [Annulohypoxylon moriforme]